MVEEEEEDQSDQKLLKNKNVVLESIDVILENIELRINFLLKLYKKYNIGILYKCLDIDVVMDDLVMDVV